jgi:hypothetical protein
MIHPRAPSVILPSSSPVKAEKTTEGASWSSLGRVSNENNLQTFFVTQ